jgi:hypothetical protein
MRELSALLTELDAARFCSTRSRAKFSAMHFGF